MKWKKTSTFLQEEEGSTKKSSDTSPIGGWTNPLEKYYVVKLDHSPRWNGVEKTKENTWKHQLDQNFVGFPLLSTLHPTIRREQLELVRPKTLGLCICPHVEGHLDALSEEQDLLKHKSNHWDLGTGNLRDMTWQLLNKWIMNIHIHDMWNEKLITIIMIYCTSVCVCVCCEWRSKGVNK